MRTQIRSFLCILISLSAITVLRPDRAIGQETGATLILSEAVGPSIDPQERDYYRMPIRSGMGMRKQVRLLSGATEI